MGQKNLISVFIIFAIFHTIQIAVGKLDHYVFYEKVITSQADAQKYNKEKNSTIATVYVQIENSTYVAGTNYSIADLLVDVPKKPLKFIMKEKPPGDMGKEFDEIAAICLGHYDHILLQIYVVNGPKPGNDAKLISGVRAIPKFKEVMKAFLETEDKNAEYSDQMMQEIMAEFAKDKDQFFLRLNGYHVKNRKVKIKKGEFVKPPKELFIYQNQEDANLTTSDVFAKLDGFDTTKIIWHNIEVRDSSDETEPTEGIVPVTKPSGSGRIEFVKFLVALSLLFPIFG